MSAGEGAVWVGGLVGWWVSGWLVGGEWVVSEW